MKSCKGNAQEAYKKYYYITYKWLNDNGVKRHGLIMGKHEYDRMICDKCFNSEDYFAEKI